MRLNFCKFLFLTRSEDGKGKQVLANTLLWNSNLAENL